MVDETEEHLYQRRLIPGTAQYTYGERPRKRYDYLHRVSDAVRDIEAGIREIALQRQNGENFSDAFTKYLLSTESALREIVTTLREQIEQEAVWASSAGAAQEVVVS